MAKLLDTTGLSHFWDAFKARLLPSGGNAGQVLSKSSSSDYSVGWKNANETDFYDGSTLVTSDKLNLSAGNGISFGYSGTNTERTMAISVDSNVVGKHYTSSGSYNITTAGIDNLKNGPHVTIPAGEYVLVGSWIFQSGNSTGTRNSQVGFRIGTSGTIWGERTRVFAAASNYAILEATAIRTFTDSSTDVYLVGSSSITSSAATCYITAVRIR